MNLFSKIPFLILVLVVLSLLFGCVTQKESENQFEKDQTLKRNWKIIDFVPKFTSINGLGVYYYFPENPKGVIYFYHGTGGNAENFFVNVETLYFAKEATARGYGVVSTESRDRKEGKWISTSDPSTNVDVKQWMDVETFLTEQGLLTSGMKRFGVGMSRGASFVSYTGGYLHYDGVAQYNAPGLPGVFSKEGYVVPTMFCYSEKDQKVSNEEIISNYNLVKAKGLRTLLLEKKVEVLDKNRFTKIPGVTLEQSVVMFNQFVKAGYVDENGVDTNKLSSIFSEDREELVPTESALIFSGLSSEYDLHKMDFVNQLRVVLADHAFHSDYSKETIDFFENK